MPTHIDFRLSREVELGASRRDNEDLEIIQLESGHERINLLTAASRLEFDISYPISTRTHPRLLELMHAFKATRGGWLSFDFRDWLDNQVTDEPFVVGDGATTVFPLIKGYDFGTASYARPIQRPVSGTVTLKKNGVATATGFTVDYDLGLVTFAAAPIGGGTPDLWSWSGEFNVPVRFDGVLETRAPTIRLEKVGTITLVEKRLKAADFA